MRTDTLQLVVFTGLQASGKSSFYRARFAGTHVHVSKDLWPSARHPERRQRRLIAEALGAGRSVVVDNTNPTPAERAPLLMLGRAHGATLIACYFEATVPECLARNQDRPGRARVPDVALFATARRLVRPGRDEGFAELWTVRLQADGSFVTIL